MTKFYLFSTGINAELLGILTHVENAMLDEKVKNYKTLTLDIGGEEPLLGLIDDSKDIVFIDENNKFQEFHILEMDEIDEELHSVQLTCEQSVQEIIDNIVIGLQPTTNKIDDYVNYILAGTRFHLGTVESGIYDEKYSGKLETMNSMEALNTLIKSYDCEYEVRYETDKVNKITKRYIDLKKQVGGDLGKVFSIGKDVTSVRRIIDVSNISTAIYPYVILPAEAGKEPEKLTIKEAEWSVANGDPVDKPLGEELLVNTNISEKYSRFDLSTNKKVNRVMKAEFQSQNVSTPQELLSQGWNILRMSANPRVTYELKAVDLYMLTGDESFLHENVRLGDICSLVDKNFTPSIEITTRVVERHIDLLDPSKSTFVLGDSARTMSTEKGENEKLEEQMKNLEDIVNNINMGDLDFLVSGKFEYDVIKQQNQDELISSSGYTYATDSEGLWVFDDPKEGGNPTKVVIIKGGCMGFGERDTQTNEWVFDTFINGSSVNASLINTGELNGELLKANTIDALALKQEAYAMIGDTIMQSTSFQATIDGVVIEARQGMATLEDLSDYIPISDRDDIILDSRTGMVTESKMNTAIEQAKEDAREGMISSTELQTAIDGVYITNAKMGQYNLLKNSDGSHGIEEWVTSSYSGDYLEVISDSNSDYNMAGERTFAFTTHKTSGYGAMFYQNVTLSPNTTYTLSYWIACHRCTMDVSVYQGGYINWKRHEGTIVGGKDRNNWVFDYFTFTTKDSTTPARIEFAIASYGDLTSDYAYEFVTKPCLVIGDVPKAWTGHPDELNINITSITESGVKVEHNNSSTYTILDSEGLSVNDVDTGKRLAYFGQSNSAYIDRVSSNELFANNAINNVKENTGTLNVYVKGGGSGDLSGRDANNCAPSFAQAQQWVCSQLNLKTDSFRNGFTIGANAKIYFHVDSGVIVEPLIQFSNIGGDGQIDIDCSPSTTIRGTIKISGCTTRFMIYGNRSNIDTNDGAIFENIGGGSYEDIFAIANSKSVFIWDARFRSDITSSGTAIRCTYGSHVCVLDCDCYKFNAGFVCDFYSTIYIRDYRGSEMNRAGRLEGRMFRGGKYPDATTAFSNAYHYFDTANPSYLPITPSPSLQFAPPPPVIQTVKQTFVPSRYYSVRPTYTEEGVLYQSDWNGTYGNWVGHVTFDSNLKTWLSDCTGYTAEIYLSRMSTKHGNYGGASIYLKDYGTIGSLALGEGKWFKIPTSFIDQFKSGSRTELVFNGTGNSYYCKFNNDVKLWIEGSKPI